MTIRLILAMVLSAVYTSAWWACVHFGWLIHNPTPMNPDSAFPLFIIPVMMTVVIVILLVAYTANHWNDK